MSSTSLGILLTVLFVLNLPIYWLRGTSLFGSWEGFVESVVALIVPDIVSAASGKYEDHRIGRFTLLLYLLVCVSTFAAEYHVVAKFLLGVKDPW